MKLFLLCSQLVNKQSVGVNICPCCCSIFVFKHQSIMECIPVLICRGYAGAYNMHEGTHAHKQFSEAYCCASLNIIKNKLYFVLIRLVGTGSLFVATLFFHFDLKNKWIK